MRGLDIIQSPREMYHSVVGITEALSLIKVVKLFFPFPVSFQAQKILQYSSRGSQRGEAIREMHF